MDEIGRILRRNWCCRGDGVEHDVAECCPDLLFEIKTIAVISKRSAMNFKNERIFFWRIEIGRLDNPALNLRLSFEDSYQISSTRPGTFCCSNSWLMAVSTRIAPLVETAHLRDCLAAKVKAIVPVRETENEPPPDALASDNFRSLFPLRRPR